MTELALELGVGGAVAVILVREAFTFIRENRSRRNGNGKAGDKATEFWQQDVRDAVEEKMNSVLKPVLEKQTEILREIRDAQARANDGIKELVTLERSRPHARRKG